MEISLRAARVNKLMTQEQVAAALGVSKNTIVNYELYRTIPDIDTAKNLATLYGITVDDIKWTAD